MVGHYEAAELQAGAQEAVCRIVPEFDFGIVVLEVGGHASGAEVAPLADYGIPQESVVGFVGIAEHHHIVELATDLAPWADGGAGVDFSAHVDCGVLQQGYGAPQTRALHHLHVAAYVDRAVRGVEHHAFNHRPAFNENLLGRAYHHIAPVHGLPLASLREKLEVGLYPGGVHAENIGEGAHLGHAAVIFDGIDLHSLAADELPEAAGTAAVGHKQLAAVGIVGRQGCVGGEAGERFGQCRLGHNVRCNEKSVGSLGHRIFLAEIRGGEIGVQPRQERLPLLAEGACAQQKVGHRAGVRQRQELVVYAGQIEKYYVACHYIFISMM